MATAKHWTDRIVRALESLGGTSAVSLQLELGPSPEENRRLMKVFDELWSQDNLQRVLKNFVDRTLIRRLRAEFDARRRNINEYEPKYFEYDEDYQLLGISGFKNVGQWLKGLERVIHDVVQYKMVSFDSGNAAAIQVGDGKALFGHRLGDYDVLGQSANSTSQIDNLFLATEFGTGVAENTGGNPRTDEGPTKDPTFSGSWWVGASKDGEVGPRIGVHKRGQKGFHFLFEAREGNMKKVWINLIEDVFEQHLLDELVRDMRTVRG